MKVLVTGATGFVGRQVVRELHHANHEVHFLTRRPQSASAHAIEDECSGQVHFGSVSDNNLLRGACEGIDAVIHLVGIISEAGSQTFESVHLRGTENIVAAAKQGGVKRFIHMSALGTRPNAAARYHQTKWAAEECVRQSGLDWTIFRPSIIYGPRDGFVNLFAGMIRRSPVVPVIGNGETKFQPVPVEVVATAFAKSVTEPKAIGQTYDLAGNETFTMDEIVDMIGNTIGKKRAKVHLPLPVARTQAAFLEFVYADMMHKSPPLNRDQIVMLQEDNVGNGRPAAELFALHPGTFRDGISRYLKG